jgi:hypothetical protein
MTMEETKRARHLVKSIYADWARGDFTTFKDRLTDDFELFVPEYLPWGHFNGQQNA